MYKCLRVWSKKPFPIWSKLEPRNRGRAVQAFRVSDRLRGMHQQNNFKPITSTDPNYTAMRYVVIVICNLPP